MKILITGGAGFIGSNLVRRLQTDPTTEIAVIDNFSTGRKENLAGLNVELFEGSILDRDLLGEAARGAAAIVHLAARPSVPRSIKNPLATHHANATGTLHVLEAARESGAHVSVASSSSVYGANPQLPKREDLRPMPVSPYAVSKLATESYAMAYGVAYNVPVLPFRFFNVYGPGQAAGHAYAAVIPAFLDAALSGRPLPIHGDGTQTRDFTYVDTVTQALAEAAYRRVTSTGPLNLAFGVRNSLIEVIDIIERALGLRLKREYLGWREGDVQHSQADSERLSALFPNLPAYSLEDGIASTLAWFRENKP